jgi:hypothetical protein
MIAREMLRILINEMPRAKFYSDEDWVAGGEQVHAVIRTKSIANFTIDEFAQFAKPSIEAMADGIRERGDKFIVGYPRIVGQEQGTVRDPLTGLVLRYVYGYDIQHDDFVLRLTILCRAFEWK